MSIRGPVSGTVPQRVPPPTKLPVPAPPSVAVQPHPLVTVQPHPPVKPPTPPVVPPSPPPSPVPPKSGYGVHVGRVQPGSWEEELDKNWYNNDGAIDQLEAAMAWASVTMNALYSASVRIHDKGAPADGYGDVAGAIHIHVVPAEMEKGLLRPLAKAGARVTLEAEMALFLEIVAPQHLKKVFGREAQPNEIFAFVGKTLATKHVPIWDYLTVLTARDPINGPQQVAWAKNAFLAEANRIGWVPPPQPQPKPWG